MVLIFSLKSTHNADYASSAIFLKSPKIMLIFLNYAKHYASTIEKSLRVIKLCQLELRTNVTLFDPARIRDRIKIGW